MKKIISVFIILLFCISHVSATPLNDISSNIYNTTPSPCISSVGGEWAVIGLIKSGAEIPSDFYKTYYNNAEKQLIQNNGVLSSSKNTEYARSILALAAIGANPENIAGYNLLIPLTDFDKTMRQGINGAIWALIALNCANFETVSSDISEKYLSFILSSQCEDGGWSLDGKTSDTDTTAMALCALANHRHSSNVSNAITPALEFLSENQLENGGFLNRGTENCESAAQVLIALSCLNISYNDSRFVKNKSVYDNLMSFYNNNGGFFHSKTSTETSRMATEQALCALTSLNSEKSVYDMHDIPKTNYTAENISNVKKTFSDIQSHPAQMQIEYLASHGIISGMDENHFFPNSNMTRAEFSSIITRCLNISPDNEQIFNDVTTDKWYFGVISAAYKNNIISGISENEFNPNGLITKEEAALMLFRSAKYLEKNTEYNENILFEFDDYTLVSSWAKKALAFCFDYGIIPDDDVLINPQTPVIRSEIAVMIYNLLK